MKKYNFIIIDPKDNCATAFEMIPQDSSVELAGKNIIVNHAIPLGHKFALVDIMKGSDVMKYGEIIGVATEDIGKGDWIHVHNISSNILKVKNDG